jgi:hypothetical protein
MKTGFFNIEILRSIENAPSFSEAKKIAIEAVNSQPKALPKNKKMALDMISRCGSIKSLLIGCGNFLLSHPSEGLGMTRGE